MKKTLGCLGDLLGMTVPTHVLWGLFHKTVPRIPIRQPVIQWKVRPFFLVAHMVSKGDGRRKERTSGKEK